MREDTDLMLGWLKRRSLVSCKALELYGEVVTAARNPWFYGAGRVADTPEGRFELVALHLFLVAERAKGVVPDGEAVAQAMIEAFVTDMDDCMREMGVGDLTVPKRVQWAAATFYERAGAYRAGLASRPSAAGDVLIEVARTALLRPNAEPSFADAHFADELARYIRQSAAKLAHFNPLSTDHLKFADIQFAEIPNNAGTSA
jgi:cytochrome b pre-mRNA-processing protein 3